MLHLDTHTSCRRLGLLWHAKSCPGYALSSLQTSLTALLSGSAVHSVLPFTLSTRVAVSHLEQVGLQDLYSFPNPCKLYVNIHYHTDKVTLIE